MGDGYFVTPSQAPQIEMKPGIYRRTLAHTDEVLLCEFFLQRESVVTPHSHQNDQVGYVVFGRLEITIGTDTRLCEPGDSYAIPGGIEHSARALQDTLTVDVFSPPRNDYQTDAR